MNPDSSDFDGIGMTSLRTRQRLVQRLRGSGIQNEAVLSAILNIPRHLFVDEALASRAYEDTALPIGFGQTISQPYVVARMIESLFGSLTPGKVLEVGTGSGYQTAVLAALVDRVFSIERVGKLRDRATFRLRQLGLRNVRLKHDDGRLGWNEFGPFDGILVSAAADELPADLLAQLTIGGRLVAPIGPPKFQNLLIVERTATDYEQHSLDSVSFVPLLEGVI